MSHINKIIISGNLTREPETTETKGGQVVCKLTVANNREWKDKKTGEKKKATNFFMVSTWNACADNCQKYLVKGQNVIVDGRLEIRSYEKDGEKKWITEIIAQDIHFGAKPKSHNEPSDAEEKDLPF